MATVLCITIIIRVVLFSHKYHNKVSFQHFSNYAGNYLQFGKTDAIYHEFKFPRPFTNSAMNESLFGTVEGLFSMLSSSTIFD